MRITAMAADRAEPAGAIPPSAGLRPLPFPEFRHADRQAQAVPQRQRAMISCWWSRVLLAALRPAGPYPVLALIGEQGTAKTTLLRLLRSLLDPSAAPSCRVAVLGPRSVHRRPQLARHGVREHLEAVRSDVGLSLPACRPAAGCAPARCSRIPTRRCCGRPPDRDGGHRQLHHPRRFDGPRRHPRARAAARSARPKPRCWPSSSGCDLACSAHCSIISVTGVRQLPDTHLADLPRMADFATWAVACGLDAFEAAYRATVRLRSTSRWNTIRSPARCGR